MRCELQEQRRDADNVESNGRTIHKQKMKLYVRRGYAFRLAEGEQLISDEEFYRKRPRGGFEKTGSIVPQNGVRSIDRIGRICTQWGVGAFFQRRKQGGGSRGADPPILEPENPS